MVYFGNRWTSYKSRTYMEFFYRKNNCNIDYLIY